MPFCPAAELTVKAGNEERSYKLDDRPCRIGRARENTIVLDSELISRHHTLVQAGGGAYIIYDLGSRNGTFLNGKRLTAPAELRDGDTIAIGQFELSFSAREQSAEMLQ